jgi:hypothetical protein
VEAGESNVEILPFNGLREATGVSGPDRKMISYASRAWKEGRLGLDGARLPAPAPGLAGLWSSFGIQAPDKRGLKLRFDEHLPRLPKSLLCGIQEQRCNLDLLLAATSNSLDGLSVR